MAEQAKIRVLSPHVANKIAAGEVVERPASVVRELVDNSFDAGATQIDIEITAGGRNLISISDNGSGMNRDDALLSLERHATSKIHDVDDIEHINTMGFRGEALAAIASVSRLRMVTKRSDDETGTELVTSAGKIQDVRDIGAPAGTVIEIRDLFFNVPARKKFLRTYQTEFSHIRQTFLFQALSHPLTGMTLKADGRKIYSTPADGKLEDRITDLFGMDYLGNFKKVDHDANGISVTGYTSIPSYNRPDRDEQYIFINGRATWAPILNHSIREGYHTLLSSDRHPALVLFIDLDPGLVDVNVHPAKKEVRFRESSDVRDALISALKNALQNRAAIQPVTPERKGPADLVVPAPFAKQLTIADLPEIKPFKYQGKINNETPQTGKTADGTPDAEQQGIRKRSFTPPWTWSRILGQFGGLYVVIEMEDGYAIMDPHAAHERILFEKFLKAFETKKVQVQDLLIPETVELNPKDAMVLRKNMNIMKSMGFGISEFGGDSFVLDSIPSCFSGVSGRSLMIDIADNLETAGTRGGKGRWREESIAQAACKSAVKARDKMTIEEIERLISDLAQADMPYTCPHGRPTLIFYSYRELNKKFGRE